MVTCAPRLNTSKTVLVSFKPSFQSIRLISIFILVSDIAEVDREACGAGLSERECDELKCCYDPRSTIQCYRPQVNFFSELSQELFRRNFRKVA